jgi:hydrogenase/urease accessory protein HupE
MNKAGKAQVIRNQCRLGLLVSAFLAILSLENALAHKTSLTAAEITVAGKQVAFRLKVSAHDLAVALGIETDLVTPVSKAVFVEHTEALARYLGARLVIRAQNTLCSSKPAKVDYAFLPEELVLKVDYDCSEPPERLTIDYLLFFDIDPTHRSLGRIILPSGEEQFLFDRTLTRLEFEITRPQLQSRTALFGRVFFLGVEHILIGYDHILFLLALLIVSVNFWQMVKVASAFTVAHSITLALAWYGVVDLPSPIVESIIALSIVYVAIDNIVRQHFGQRWVLAGGFGLVHGLGFYSALRDLGLGKTDTATTLLAFNLGVESGQIAVIALVFWPLVWWRRQQWYRPSARACSLAILLVVSWWVIERVFTGIVLLF